MDADQLFNAGVNSARAGEYECALSSLQVAASLGDHSPELYRLIGKVHVHLGNIREAEDRFRKVLAVNPGDKAAAKSLAVVRRFRLVRRSIAAVAVLACTAVVVVAAWVLWMEFLRLDNAIAAISAQTATLQAAPPARVETVPPAAPKSEIQPRPSPPPPVTPQAAVPTPAPKPVTQPKPSPAVARPATVPSPIPKPEMYPKPPSSAPMAAELFQSQYKQAVEIAFKGDLERALEMLTSLSGEQDAGQQLAGNVHFWMGRCLYELGRPRDALDHFRIVVERYPSSPKFGEAKIDVERCERKLAQEPAKPPKPTKD